jgi:thiol-disulfide isomerase/thioredoxin
MLQTDDLVSQAYKVTATPSAVLLRDGKIASAVATGAEAIRALLARATLPPVVKKGETSPELRLPDMSGTAVNLAELRDRRTLILFWNPSCGFCRQLQPALKSWEQNRNEESPELLVISSGSLEEIRQEGFRARVLLDQNFAAGQVFDVEGTPAAVMIDESGRVVSDVAVGGPDVLALAGAGRLKGREQEMHAAVR